MKKPCALVLASVALFTACGGDNKGTNPNNTASSYTVTVTGLPGLTQTSGNAFWVEGTDDQGTPAFVIGLQPTGSTQFGFVFFRTGAGRAPAGDYDFVDLNAESPTPDQFQMIGNLSPSATESYECAAISGTHHISSSDNSRVKGTFTVQGQCASTTSSVPPLDVTFEGTYDAQKAAGVSALSGAHPARLVE